MELGISFGIDELPPEPEDKCMYCKELILEIKYVPFVICGDIKDVHYFEAMCKYCYVEKWLE